MSAAKRIIVVLGMHRSGTSTIARALKVLGVDLGSNLLPPAPGDNERGYFEDADIHALNMELLLALGHDWHTLEPLSQAELEGPVAKEYRDRAVALLRDKVAPTQCFGLKDPRISRLLPFWKGIFAELEVAASYAIVSRNPLSVARSLARRDGFDPVKSHYLWLEHTVASLRETAGARRVAVDYDIFLDALIAQLRRLAERLGLPFDPGGRAFLEFREEFVAESMRHSRFTLDDLERDPQVPRGVAQLFEALHAMATDREGADGAALDALLERLVEVEGDLRPALAYMRTYEEKAHNVGVELVHREAQSAARQQGLEQAHQQAAQELRHRDAQIAQLTSTAENLDRKVAALEAEIAAAQHKLELVRGEIAAREAEANGLREAAARRDEVNSSLGAEVVAREKELVVLGATLAEEKQRRASLESELASCEGKLADRERDLAGLRAQWGELLATTWSVPRPAKLARRLRERFKGPRSGS